MKCLEGGRDPKTNRLYFGDYGNPFPLLCRFFNGVNAFSTGSYHHYSLGEDMSSSVSVSEQIES